MNGTMKRENFERFEIEKNLVSEDCKASGFSMAAVAGGILLCIGIIIYAVLTHWYLIFCRYCDKMYTVSKREEMRICLKCLTRN